MSQSDEVLASLVAAVGDQAALVASSLELQRTIADRVAELPTQSDYSKVLFMSRVALLVSVLAFLVAVFV